MKIAFIQCPGWGRDCPPYTPALFSSILRRAGHEVFNFDLNNALYCSGPSDYRKYWDDKDLYSFWANNSLISKFLDDNRKMIDLQLDKILNSDAKIIGFSVQFSSLVVSLAIARMIKERDKTRIVVFGGPDCCRQLRADLVIRNDAVDAVAIGEGELTFLDLIDIINKKGKIDFCKGFIIKENGNIVDCGDGAIVEELDNLPFPDYSDFREDILYGLYQQPERLEIFDSRSCITKCHFCSEWQYWRKFRSMSGQRMYAEITHQIKNFPTVNYFYFIGSLLNGDIKALDKFCDLIIENGIKTRWAGQPIVRKEMGYALLKKMRQAGCEWLGYGIESGSEKIVRGMNKRFLMSDAEQVLKDTKRAGISTQANFMFGIPGETKEDFKLTLEFLKRNYKYMDSILASQSFCVIDKGTYLYEQADQFGIKDRDHHLYWEAEEENTYPERFRRYEEFCQLALSLGIPETSGVLKVKPDKWLLLGDYYLFKDNYQEAENCYKKSKKSESSNELISQKIDICRNQLNKHRTRAEGAIFD
jgi:anaerobic magnesium-protoporphyrin IX monomethyl ester cyclase